MLNLGDAEDEPRAWCMGGKCSAHLLTSPGPLLATVTESLRKSLRKSATIWMCQSVLL